MFYYLYCSMPGTKRVKIALMVGLIAVILAVIFFFVFPWLSGLMQPDTIVYR